MCFYGVILDYLIIECAFKRGGSDRLSLWLTEFLLTTNIKTQILGIVYDFLYST